MATAEAQGSPEPSPRPARSSRRGCGSASPPSCVILAVAALVSTGGSDKKKSTTPAGVEQTRPVTVTGTALPEAAAERRRPRRRPGDPRGRRASRSTAPRSTSQGRQAEADPLRRPLVPPLPAGGAAAGQVPEVEPAPEGRRPLHRVDRGVNSPRATTRRRPGWPTKAGPRRRWPTPATRGGHAFGLPGFPYFVAVDGSGKVVARTTGEITTDEFAGLAAKALGGQ